MANRRERKYCAVPANCCGAIEDHMGFQFYPVPNDNLTADTAKWTDNDVFADL